MELIHYLDVSYLPSGVEPNSFQTFDIYIPRHILVASYHLPDTSGLICFIHGGAWRAEDKADHSTLARNLAMFTGHPVAVPNYRLTPREPTPEHYLHHPEHAKDALQFLEFILSWHEGNGGGLPRKPSKLFLIGHSCSAHMLCTIFLCMPGDSNSERVCPSDELVQSTAAVIMSEGIYDIDILLSSFPRYRTWFIENTFGSRNSFEDVSAIKATIDPRGQHIYWLIVHSKGDTLVDERQSQEIYDSLTENLSVVFKSFGRLEEEHNDILRSSQYIDIIHNCIQGVMGEQAH